MIDKKHDLPITRQAKALKLSRGSVYYLPRPVPAADLAIMRRMDELHLEFPFAGSRMLRDLLNAEGFETGRRHVVTLMKRMAIEAIYRKPNTSKPTPGHMIYPYLLRISCASCRSTARTRSGRPISPLAGRPGFEPGLTESRWGIRPVGLPFVGVEGCCASG